MVPHRGRVSANVTRTGDVAVEIGYGRFPDRGLGALRVSISEGEFGSWTQSSRSLRATQGDHRPIRRMARRILASQLNWITRYPAAANELIEPYGPTRINGTDKLTKTRRKSGPQTPSSRPSKATERPSCFLAPVTRAASLNSHGMAATLLTKPPPTSNTDQRPTLTGRQKRKRYQTACTPGPPTLWMSPSRQ